MSWSLLLSLSPPQVSQTLSMTIDDFYNTRATFLSNLAFVLGISVSRIRIISITPGSVVLR